MPIQPPAMPVSSSQKELKMSEENTNIDGIVAARTFAEGLISVVRKFNFKARSLKNEKGEEIEKLPKQPSLEAPIPIPTGTSLIAILEQPDNFTDTQPDGSIVTRPNVQKQLIVDAVSEVIFSQAKQQLDAAIESFGADKTKTVNVSFLDYDKLTLEYIASIPPARRGAAAISEEEWNDWFKDYLNTMVQATGKPLEKLEKHIDIFKKPAKYRARKDLLQVLVEQLAIYASAATSLDEFSTQYTRMNDTLTKYLTEEDRIDVDAL